MWIDDEANVRWYKNLYLKQGFEVAALKEEIEALKEELRELNKKTAYYKDRSPAILGDLWEEPKVIEANVGTSTLTQIASSHLTNEGYGYHVIIKSKTDIPNKNEVGFSYFISKDVVLLNPGTVTSVLTVLHKRTLDELTKQLFE